MPTRTSRVSARSPQYLLVSEVFPPRVGGSGILLHNIYSRITDAPVTALVDVPPSLLPKRSAMRITPTHISARAWGVFDPRGWPNQLNLARKLYALGSFGRAIVHCGRAQPEAVPARLARLMVGGPPFLFWAHGEDIAAALSSRQYAVTMRMVYAAASAAIANSANTARMIRSTGWHSSEIHVVYPGVDSQRFRPDADDGVLRSQLAPRGEIVLLSVARLQKRKGHDLVLRALPMLLEDIPGLRYVIVGDGAESSSLRQLAADLRLDRVVVFTGEVPDEDLPKYFAACDIFVLPTRVEVSDFEGFGIVYLEAAAAGKPAIGGRNGGVPEAVAEGETGLLVSGEDVGELREAIRVLAVSQHMRRAFGEAGRRRAIADFTWEKAAAEVSRIHALVAAASRTG